MNLEILISVNVIPSVTLMISSKITIIIKASEIKVRRAPNNTKKAKYLKALLFFIWATILEVCLSIHKMASFVSVRKMFLNGNSRFNFLTEKPKKSVITIPIKKSVNGIYPSAQQFFYHSNTE